jgi:hypothetical protein
VGTAASVLCKLAVVHWRTLFGCKGARPASADGDAHAKHQSGGAGNGAVAAALEEHRAAMAAALEAANVALDARLGASLQSVAVAVARSSGGGAADAEKENGSVGGSGSGGGGGGGGGSGAALGAAASPGRAEALMNQET